MTGFPEQRLKMLEESAFKEKREIETRQNAEELHRYLDFADVDWKNVGTSGQFEVVNFDKYRDDWGVASLEERIARR
jgi:hypothetical protein